MAASADSGVGHRVTATEIGDAVVAAGLKPLWPESAGRFARYLQLLLRWNAKLNLTAVRDPSQIVQRHFIECMQCAQALPVTQTLLDFGSGAGLPGIPIAISRPEILVTLGESQGKKAAFLREVVRELSLNAEVYDQRIERMGGDRTFEAVTMRAVDRMEEAVDVARERVVPDGLMVLFATAMTEERLKGALADLNWERRIPVSGLKSGLLLFGRKLCSR